LAALLVYGSKRSSVITNIQSVYPGYDAYDMPYGSRRFAKLESTYNERDVAESIRIGYELHKLTEALS
jgi:hypothetical protein